MPLELSIYNASHVCVCVCVSVTPPKSEKKWQKVAKSCKKWKKWQKVAKSGKKWQKWQK